MTEISYEAVDDNDWEMRLLLPEDVSAAAKTMRKYGASYEEIGMSVVHHFQSNDSRTRGTSIFRFVSNEYGGEGIIVLTHNGYLGKQLSPHNNQASVVINRYGIPDHEKIDDLVEYEMMKYGVDDYVENSKLEVQHEI